MQKIKIQNPSGADASLQIGIIGNVAAGETIFPLPVFLKNITSDDITGVQVKLVNMTEYVSTTMYVGWNVEQVIAVKGVTANKLQWGR